MIEGPYSAIITGSMINTEKMMGKNFEYKT